MAMDSCFGVSVVGRPFDTDNGRMLCLAVAAFFPGGDNIIFLAVLCQSTVCNELSTRRNNNLWWDLERHNTQGEVLGVDQRRISRAVTSEQIE